QDAYDTTNHRHYPATLQMSDNNNPADTSATVSFTLTATTSLQLLQGHIYWKCNQTSDTTAKWYAILNSNTQSPFSSIVGSNAVNGVIGSDHVGVSYSSGTFGTWPNPGSATSWVEMTTGTAATMAVSIASIP